MDRDFFETIDTEGKAYWLGFIAADGCVSDRGLSIHLSHKDHDHLVLFSELVGGSVDVTYKGASRFRSGISKVVQDLVSHGVHPRKTLTLEPPVGVPDSLIHHWIRGYFDGDGSVYPKKNKSGLKIRSVVTILGTESVINFIKNVVGLGNIHVLTGRKGGNKLWRYYIGIPRLVEQFRSYLYEDSTIFLERKHRRFHYEWAA